MFIYYLMHFIAFFMFHLKWLTINQFDLTLHFLVIIIIATGLCFLYSINTTTNKY